MSSTEETAAVEPPNGKVKAGADEETPKQIVATSEATTPWGTYLNQLNGKYQEKIRKAAQHSTYSLTMEYEDGRKITATFARRKLLQYQFDEIEELRSEATELSALGKPREAQKALARMYSKAAGYILWNTKESKIMTTEEYKHCVFSEIRPALDASMLLGLISDPN